MRSSVRRAAALMGLLVAVSPLATSAQETSGRVVGRILNTENAGPVRAAQVFIASLGIGGLTSLDGRYVLRNVPAGVSDL